MSAGLYAAALFVLIGIAAIGMLVVLAARGFTGFAPPSADEPPLRLPEDGELTQEDLAQVQFRVVTRGYRMDEVDALLDRLRAQLPEREVEAMLHVTPEAAPVETVEE